MRGRALAAALLAAVACGCGVSAESAPHALPTDEVPFGLLSPSASPTVATVPAPRVPHLFFVRDHRLVGVSRKETLAGPADLLAQLLRGPTAFEASHRVRTAISPDTRLLPTRRTGDTLAVDLSGQFVQLRGEEQILAIAQLVYTATSTGEVRAVVFRLNGKPLDVPQGDGTLTGRPVTRADYRELAPPARRPPASASASPTPSRP